jgi:hypothetical protein
LRNISLLPRSLVPWCTFSLLLLLLLLLLLSCVLSLLRLWLLTAQSTSGRHTLWLM